MIKLSLDREPGLAPVRIWRPPLHTRCAGLPGLPGLPARRHRRFDGNNGYLIFCTQWLAKWQCLDYPHPQAFLRGGRVGESMPSAGIPGDPPRTVLQIRLDNGETPRAIQDELYREFQGRLLAFARKRMNNAADAEDVVDDVFAKMLKHFDDMIKREPVDGWIFLVARREIASFYRKPKDGLVDPEIIYGDWSERIADDAAEPYETAEKFDAGQQARAHLVVLTERGWISRADLQDFFDHVVMEVKQRELAEKRGVGQPRIAQRKAAVAATVRISYYLCYLLGTVRPPYREKAISEHLEIFDLNPGPLKDADRKLLRSAGSAVTAGPDGEVVVLRREDAQAAIKPADLSELHDAESVYAGALGNPTPHCIARPCSRHKPSATAGGETR